MAAGNAGFAETRGVQHGHGSGGKMHALDSIASLALAHKETTEQSYQMAADVIRRGVPGDVVECGVFAGAQCAAMARAILDHGLDDVIRTGECWPRRVHLFDSFAGIPEPGPQDTELLASGNQPGSAACSLEQVKDYMKLWQIPDELLVYHPGWFSETLPPSPLGNDQETGWRRELKAIAVLRIDCDLYESTKLVMDNLYPLLSPGGWLIVDDWNLSGCRKAVDEVTMLHPAYFQKL